MSWADVQCGIDGWIRKAGLTPYWEHQHCKVKCEPYVMLNISDVDTVQHQSLSYVEENGELFPFVCSVVEFVLSLRIDTTDHTPDRDAVALMNRVRMFLELPSVHALLKSKNVTHKTSTAIRRVDYERLDEIISRASLDMVLSTSMSIRDSAIPWIETITVSTNHALEGTALNASLQLDEEDIT